MTRRDEHPLEFLVFVWIFILLVRLLDIKNSFIVANVEIFVSAGFQRHIAIVLTLTRNEAIVKPELTRLGDRGGLLQPPQLGRKLFLFLILGDWPSIILCIILFDQIKLFLFQMVLLNKDIRITIRCVLWAQSDGCWSRLCVLASLVVGGATASSIVVDQKRGFQILVAQNYRCLIRRKI